jgi:Xaa-Pro aminopeptidase
MIQGRIALLREKMIVLGCDGFVISQPENRRYLSGFTGSSGWLFVTAHHCKLATDFRYLEQVTRQSPDFELVEMKGRLEDLLPALLQSLGARRLAFESDCVTYDQYQTIAAALPSGVELVPTKEVVRQMRAVKEHSEIEALRKAVAITDEAIQNVRAILRPGMTEREVAWQLERHMREAGGAVPPFDIIVAAGPSGAMAHAMTSERPIQAGEPIVIDMGCRWEGYCSDLTRTLIIGEQSGLFGEIYETVLQAQLAAEAGIVAGMTGRAAHDLARQVIEKAGHGDKFGHGLGHGVGLAIHELPQLSPLSEGLLAPGMVFSIEPGIYLPGWGGVRIEDLATLHEHGLTVFSGADKRPVVPLRQ